MGLTEFIQRGMSGIVAHPYGTRFVNDVSGCMKAIVIMRSVVPTPGYHRAHGMQYFSECLFHVLGLLEFVFRIRSVETQYRDPVFINNGWIDFTIAVFARDRFASACHANMRPEKIAVIFL